MGGFFKGLALVGIVAGVAVVAYDRLLDDDAKEKVLSMVETGTELAKDAIGRAAEAIQNTSLDDLGELAQNQSWIDRQWRDIGY